MAKERTGSYISGLNGFRAIAALLVVLYHLQFPYARGGLLGVTAFFAVSGFLVTRNLYKEAESNGRVDLLQFMKKRLFRIMPALIFMCVVTIILFAVFNRVLFTKEVRDLFSTLTCWNNWHQIFSNVSYFENAGAPSPLTHTWSLSLEMQFYVLIALLFFFTGRSEVRKPLLKGITAAFAMISVTLMIALFDPSQDPTRVYYGTDTRLFSLLAGSLLALCEEDVRKIPLNNVISGLTGLISLLALIAMAAFIPGYSTFMFRGGQIIATVLCILIIAACLKTDSLFARALSNPVLAWIGERSYAIYLWHFPLFLLVSGGTAPSLLQSLIIIGLTVLMTLLSEIFIEAPFARGRFEKTLRIIKGTPKTEKGKRRQERVRRSFLIQTCTNLVLVSAALLCAVFVPKQNAAGDIDTLEAQAAENAALTEEKMREREEAARREAEQEKTETQDSPSTEPAEEPPVKTDEEILADIDILMIGDSVSLGASEAFYEVFPSSICDAAVSRYTTESYAIFDDYRVNHSWDGDAVIFALGANGLLYDSLEQMKIRADKKPLFLLCARAPYTSWQDSNNEEMKNFAAENENTYIIDWYAYSEGHEDWFVDDLTHLTPSGAQGYASCIKEAVLEVFKKKQ
ncbi:MAG: acyltransferase [Solobacterium sp.]|nr:acyltransferase [Solobacterium sp.]